MMQPIFITGIPRSGLGIVTEVLHAAGLQLGTPNTHAGYSKFENLEMQQNIFGSIYQNIHADSRCQYPLPIQDVVNQIEPMSIVKNVARWTVRQEINVDIPWGIHSVKLLPIWVAWYKAFPDATWIVIDRDDTSIIDSCIATSYMDAYANPELLKKLGVTERKAWMQWIKYFRELLIDAHNIIGDNLITIKPQNDSFINDMQNLVKRLQLKEVNIEKLTVDKIKK